MKWFNEDEYELEILKENLKSHRDKLHTDIQEHYKNAILDGLIIFISGIILGILLSHLFLS